MTEYTRCEDCEYFEVINAGYKARVCFDPVYGGSYEFLPDAGVDMRKQLGAKYECWPSMSHFVPKVNRD